MAKKFSELKVGDTLVVWQYRSLYMCPVKEIHPIRQFMVTDEGEQEIAPYGEFRVTLEGGADFHIFADCLDSKAFVYGTDGWHEYKILGTSKEAVKECLEKHLEADKKKLEEHTKEWLSKF